MKIGDKIENFELYDQDGLLRNLEEFKGQKLVIYFYPKDDTPGCTTQACSYRDNYHRFLNSGYKIIGISKDSIKSHKKFQEKYNLPFTLLSDPEHKIIERFGLWREKKLYGRKYMGTLRSTFILDENLVLVDMRLDVDPNLDANDSISNIK